MFYHDGKLQYEVKVDNPSPQYATMLQEAIGGIEGEMRVCLQYLFQAWGHRGPEKYKDMLLDTGTEEIAHIEILATAVAKNLEGASMETKDEMADKNPLVEAVMGGANPRHFLSAGMGAMAVDGSGNPFNGSWVISSGNGAADMYANIAAESSSRLLVARLWEAAEDKGMKDMCAFLLARDTMHQNQWLAAIEDMGGPEKNMPIPNSFSQEDESEDFNYTFISTSINKDSKAEKGRWSQGKSMDGNGEFSFKYDGPHGQKPHLKKPSPMGYAQKNQMDGKFDESLGEKVKDKLS